VPAAAEVVFLGDGEFDGYRLLRRLQHYGWHYVCRTKSSPQANLNLGVTYVKGQANF